MEYEVGQECRRAVAAEDAFVDEAFAMGPVQGLTPERVKLFIRYVADVRMSMLGYQPVFGVSEDPEPWFEKVIGGVEFVNFFENRSTAYSKGASSGSFFDD